MQRTWIILFLVWLLSSHLISQQITSVHTRWDDSFREWILYDANSEEEGSLTMRWELNDDWSKWDYRLGEISGSIDMKWRDNPEEWEVRGFDELVYARTVWPRDLSRWRLKDDEITIQFGSRFTHRADEWSIQTKQYGDFVIYTEFEADPRDWIIIDELSEEVSFTMKLAMIFLAIHHGSPRQ